MKVFYLKYFIPLFLLLFIACGNEDKKDINMLLDSRNNAYETKDEKSYSELIIQNYSVTKDGGKVDKEDIINQFKMNVSPFDKIHFSKSERRISVENGKANVVIDSIVDLSIEAEKVEYKTKELLVLNKNSSDQWKISKESELDLFRGFVFGGNN